MKKFKTPRFFTEMKNKATLSQRIMYLNTAVILFLGIILVLFINIVAPFFITNEMGSPDTLVLVNSTNGEGGETTLIKKTPAPEEYTTQKDTPLIQNDPLAVIKTLSIIGVIFICGIGYFASKLVAKISLQPVTRISNTAQLIGSHTLNQRINYPGAQDEIKTLSDVLDSMLDRLEKNFEDQGEFIANLAHELRTPLTSLRMNLELLNDNPQATLDEYKTFSETAERAVNRLERLVEDLLMLAKDEKETDFHQFLLGILFEDIFEELNPIAKEHNIQLKIINGLEIEVWGDPILLHRAVANLVENGIRYNNAGGNVEISGRTEENHTIIEIRDNGIGISDEQQIHIFERFYQVKDSLASYHLSKGLGLDIAAHIIALHHGKIEIESVPGKGSTFRICLPKTENN